MQDNKANIWIATSYGINVIDPETAFISLISEEDGLWGMEFNNGHGLNGYEAWQMFRTNKFDLVLMDLKMPELDGIEATKEIREFEKKSIIGQLLLL